MKTLRNWIFAAWIVGIVILYYRFHLFYLEALQARTLWIGVGLVTVLTGIFAWIIKRKNGLSVSYISAVAWTIVTTTLVAVIVHFARGMIGEASVLTMVTRTMGMLLGLFATLTIVLGTATSFGLFILKKLRITSAGLTQHLISLAIGMVLLQLLLFVLGLFGALTIIGVLGVLVAMVVISLPEATKLLQGSYQNRIVLSWDVRTLTPYVACIAIIVCMFNLLHLLRPIPNGWDEYVRYLNTPRILADTHILFTGVNAYPNELLMSIGFMLRDSLFIALGFSVIMGVLSALGVFALSRNFLSVKYSALAASLWYLTPFIIFQSSREVKIDLAVAFLTVTALLAIITWFRNTAEHSRTTQWLAIAGLLTGATFASKYTAIFFVIALSVSITYGLYKLRHKLALPLIVFLLATSFAYIPWAVYFINSAQVLTVDSLKTGAVITPQASCVAPPNSETASVVPERTGNEEELGRYLGYATGIQRYLLLPWTMTMNPIVRGLNVDIGPLFLGLLPILLWFLPPDTSRSRRLLTLFTVIYWLLWALLGEGVIWYGLPGFAPLIVFLVWSLDGTRLPTSLRRVALGLIAFAAVTVGVFRIYAAIPPVQIAYLAGTLSPGQYIDSVLPKYREMYELLNSVPATADEKNYIYRIGTFIPYFIRDNHRRLYTDDQMDMLTCIRSGRTDAETVAELKRQGFRFVIFDLNIPTIDQTENKTLTEKWRTTADFINKNLKILSIEQEGRNKIVLAEIP